MLRVTRKMVLELALQMMQSWDFYMSVLEFPDPVLRNANICTREWARYGAQSVIMPDTYAAALMATDAKAAITDDVELPWPAFEIILPPKLLVGNDGSITNVWVTKTPEYVSDEGFDLQSGQKTAKHQYMVAYLDEHSWGYRSFPDLQTLAEPVPLAATNTVFMAGPIDEDLELRVWRVLGRLIGGVTLAIDNARQDKPGSYPQKRARVRPGRRPVLDANTVKLGKPLKIDVRPQIREYIEGVYRGGGVPSVRTLVRGYWKMQHHGAGRALRKRIAIAPHYRGEGPLLIRPTKLHPGSGDDGSFEGLMLDVAEDWS